MNRLRDVTGLPFMVGDDVRSEHCKDIKEVLKIRSNTIFTVESDTLTFSWSQLEINTFKFKILNPERLRAKDSKGELVSVGDTVSTWGEVLGITKAISGSKYDSILVKDSETNSGLALKYAITVVLEITVKLSKADIQKLKDSGIKLEAR
jgi:hypothetical protein